MKTLLDKKTLIVSASTLLAGFLAAWIIFGGNKHHPGKKNINATEINQATTWTCSMHPQIRQSKPGDCPICGMDLIPLENINNSEIDPMAVTMSETAIQLANVSTALVTKTRPVKEIRLDGKVQTDERSIFSQSSHIPGRIEELLVNFTGEYVNKGQTIAKIYSPELVTAQKELFEAQKMKESQPQLLNAAKEKLKNWKLSEDQINQITASGEIQEEFPIRADVSGYVTARKINPGDYVRKGEPIYEIADLSRLWILFDVYESEIIWIKKGDKIEFTISSLPGEKFEGTISYLDPVIDPKTRVAKARIEYNNTNGRLKPEMFVSGVVNARLTNKTNSIVVPKTAIMWTGKRSVVYIKTNPGNGMSFIMREVSLGASLGDSYIIEDGLNEGDEIVVNGTFSVDAASQLKGNPSMMNPEGTMEMTGHDHENMDMENNKGSGTQQTTGKPESINQQAKNALQPVYDDYLELKDALVADNFKDAQKAAISMQKNLTDVDMNLFTGETHKTWMNLSKELTTNLEHVSHFSDLTEIRESFRHISILMIQMSDSFNPFGKTLYIQHCPMANNNKGADWLSLEKEIKNPYFGKSMLTCGEVTNEIK